MKKILTVLTAVIATACYINISEADTGHEGATRIERGSYVQTRVVDISTSAATLFVPSSFKRPDSLCKNYSSFTVYIGSAAAGTTLSTIGLPIGASEYFRIDGSMTGPIYGLAEAGATNVKMICLDGMVQ